MTGKTRVKTDWYVERGWRGRQAGEKGQAPGEQEIQD